MWGGPEELIDILRATPVVLRTLVRGVDDERAREAPGEGEWSIVEVTAHLADAEEKAADRIARITGEDEPTIEGYDQVALAERRGYLGMALSDVLQRFEALRARRIVLLDGLDEAAWRRTGRHVDEGALTLYRLTAHMCKHDAIHLAQIARMVSRP
jgi:uncharacterized damage-inducible protein DinB